MADPILGATVQVLLEKALSLVAIDRIGLVRGFKKDLESFRESVGMIKDFLADAEVKQTGRRAVQRWLESLESAAFDADIVLDELNYEFLRRKVKSRNQLQGKVCSFTFFTKHNLSLRWRMASKIRDINIEFNKINERAEKLGLLQMVPQLLAPTTAVASSSRQTDSSPAPYVVGRDSDESKIVEILLSPSQKAVSVLPILGMGGLGKTTLAKSVCNNQQIREHFKKIWVCVSEKFEVMGLFKLILESLTGRAVELASRENVVQEIWKELDGKRYLLVLDDVWNTDQKLWDDFFGSLMGISTAHGNRCLVTTRLQTVASIVSPHHPPYQLRKLSDDECWPILEKKVVQSGEMPKELRKQVIKICAGLPLAANVIGGLLSRQGKEKWRSIVESRLSNFSEGSEIDGIMQTLKLSFDYLPSPSIKKCFAYCSLYNKDEKIDGGRLIELWMAEGFLQTDLRDEMMMEEIGGEYLDIFVQSSLLEKVEGSNDYYKMHDLVHDLTQSLSKLQRFQSEDDAINNCGYRVRYLAFGMSAGIMSLNDTSAFILKSSSMLKSTPATDLHVSYRLACSLPTCMSASDLHIRFQLARPFFISVRSRTCT